MRTRIGDPEAQGNDVKKGRFRQGDARRAQIVAGVEHKFVDTDRQFGPVSTGPSTRPSSLVTTRFTQIRASPSMR